MKTFDQTYLQEQASKNRQSKPEELWDIYDENRHKTGRVHRRGQPLTPGDYHLVVQAWLQNHEGNFLLTQRDRCKGFPLYWECTGGSADAGEDSLTAILREIREETGLHFAPEQGRCLLRLKREDSFLDVWTFQGNFSLEDVTLQPGETCGKRLAATEQILQMDEEGTLVPFSYLKFLFTNPTLLGYNNSKTAKSQEV